MATITWRSDEDLLTESKERIWNLIKEERDYRQRNGGFLVNGHWFHSDTDSRIQQMRLEKRAEVQLGEGGSPEDLLLIQGNPVLWKTMSGEMIPMTVGIAISLGNVAEATELLIFKTAEDHKNAAWASADPEAYDYSGGWPPKYEE